MIEKEGNELQDTIELLFGSNYFDFKKEDTVRTGFIGLDETLNQLHGYSGFAKGSLNTFVVDGYKARKTFTYNLNQRMGQLTDSVTVEEITQPFFLESLLDFCESLVIAGKHETPFIFFQGEYHISSALQSFNNYDKLHELKHLACLEKTAIILVISKKEYDRENKYKHCSDTVTLVENKLLHMDKKHMAENIARFVILKTRVTNQSVEVFSTY